MSATLLTVADKTVALNCSLEQAAKMISLLEGAMIVRMDFDYSGKKPVRAWVIQEPADIALQVVGSAPITREAWEVMKTEAAKEGGVA